LIRNNALPGLIIITCLTTSLLAGCAASANPASALTTTGKTTASQTTTIKYNGTYTGTFYYKHPADDSVEYKNIKWVEDSFTLTVTLKADSVMNNKTVILGISDISCSEPSFGAGIATQNLNKTYQSAAYLPFGPSTQVTDGGFYHMQVYFANGDLEMGAMAGHEGDLIVSSEGNILSNSPDVVGSEQIRNRPWWFQGNSNWHFSSWPRWGWYPTTWTLTKSAP
jgi:hypothetical protein